MSNPRTLNNLSGAQPFCSLEDNVKKVELSKIHHGTSSESYKSSLDKQKDSIQQSVKVS